MRGRACVYRGEATTLAIAEAVAFLMFTKINANSFNFLLKKKTDFYMIVSNQMSVRGRGGIGFRRFNHRVYKR